MKCIILKGMPLFGGDDLSTLVEIQIAKLGVYHHPKFGSGEVTSKDVAEIVRNFNADKNALAIDYEHQTFSEPPVPAPASGWIHGLIDKGAEGLWAEVQWTERAREAIRAKEYAFISPVLFFNSRDRVTGQPIGTMLAPPALTNMPFFDGMAPVQMRLWQKGAEEMDWKGLLAKVGIASGDEGEITEEQAVIALKAGLGLPVEATQGQALTEVVEKMPAYIYETLGLAATAKPAEVKAELLLLKNPGDTVSGAEHRALQAKAIEQTREALIAKAMAEGKITAAEKDYWLQEAEKDLEAVTIVMAKRPQIVPINQPLPKADPTPAGPGMSDIQANINRQMGISPELFAKHTQPSAS